MSDKKQARKAKKDKQQSSVCTIPWFGSIWSCTNVSGSTKSKKKKKKTKEDLITTETIVDLMNEYDKLRHRNDIKLNEARALINNTNLDVVSNKIKSKLERYFESCIIDINESNKTMNKIINVLPHYAKNTTQDVSPFIKDHKLKHKHHSFPLITDNNINNQTIQRGFNYINTIHTNTLTVPRVVMGNKDSKIESIKMTRVTSADAIKDDRVRRLSSPSGWSKKIILNTHDSDSSDDASFHESDNDDNDIEAGNNSSDISQLSTVMKHQYSDTVIINVDNPEPKSKINNLPINKLAVIQSESVGIDESDNDIKQLSNLQQNLSRDTNESIQGIQDVPHGSLLRDQSKASWSLKELQNETNDIKRQMKSIIEQHNK